MSASAALSNQDAFVWLGEIVEQFTRVVVINDRADRDANLEILSAAALTITTFTVPAALSPEYVIKAEFEKRVLVNVRDEINIAAVSAIAAARAALRNELFPSERDRSVSAVAGFDGNFCLINKHGG